MPRRDGDTDMLRVMTYNVHRCVGLDRMLSPRRIAQVIAAHAPDVVALQELDVGRRRTGHVDQAHRIAQHLDMSHRFHAALRIEEERYGNAVLTRFPMRLVKANALPGLAGRPRLEPRGALWVAIDVGGIEIQLINTHLGLRARERQAQVDALLGAEWLGHPACTSPVILCGDLNAIPSSAVCTALARRLRDVQTRLERQWPKGTWFSRYPLLRIDHVFVDESVDVLGVDSPRTPLTRVASDHLPLVAELALRDARGTARRRTAAYPNPSASPPGALRAFE